MQGFNPNYMQMMSMPQQYSPMTAMPDEQLENMYPKTYHIVQPMIENECNNMASNYGDMYCPNKAHLENMIDNIYKNVEANVEANIEADMNMEADAKGAVKDIKEKNVEKEKEKEKEKNRQFGFGGRRVLRDLTGILLIRELMRRRRPFYGYPGYYGGGYGGGYGSGYGGGYGGGYPMY